MTSLCNDPSRISSPPPPFTPSRFLSLSLSFLFDFLIIDIQIRTDLRRDRKKSTTDRHLEDSDPRGLSRLPQQCGMQAGQVSAIRWSLHEFAESHMGGYLVAFREVIMIFSVLCFFDIKDKTQGLFYFLFLQIDESAIRGRSISAKNIRNGP